MLHLSTLSEAQRWKAYPNLWKLFRLPKCEINIKTLAGDTTYTNEDRALLAGVSAAVLSDEKVKKMRVE